MALQYGNLTFGTPRTSYVGLPVNEMYQAAQKLDTDYWNNKDYYDKLEMTSRNLAVNGENEDIKQNALKALDKIKTFQANNNYEHAGLVVRDVAKEIGTNQPFLHAIKIKQADDERIKLKQTMTAAGKTPLDFSDKNLRAVNPDGSLNQWKHEVIERPDYTKPKQEIWSVMKADATQSGRVEDANVIGDLISYGWEGISADKQGKIRKLLPEAVRLYKGKEEYDIERRDLTELQGDPEADKTIERSVLSAGRMNQFGKSSIGYSHDEIKQEAIKKRMNEPPPPPPHEVRPGGLVELSDDNIVKGTYLENYEPDGTPKKGLAQIKHVRDEFGISDPNKAFAATANKAEYERQKAEGKKIVDKASDEIRDNSPVLKGLSNPFVAYAYKEALKNRSLVSFNTHYNLQKSVKDKLQQEFFHEVDGKQIPHMDGRFIQIKGNPKVFTNWNDVVSEIGGNGKETGAVEGIVPFSKLDNAGAAITLLKEDGTSVELAVSMGDRATSIFGRSNKAYQKTKEGKTGRTVIEKGKDNNGIDYTIESDTPIDKGTGKWDFNTSIQKLATLADTKKDLAAKGLTIEKAKLKGYKFTNDGRMIMSSKNPEQEAYDEVEYFNQNY